MHYAEPVWKTNTAIICACDDLRDNFCSARWGSPSLRPASLRGRLVLLPSTLSWEESRGNVMIGIEADEIVCKMTFVKLSEMSKPSRDSLPY